MKKGTLTFLVIAIIIVIAVLTNPDKTRHKEVLKSSFIEYMQKSGDSDQTDISDESDYLGDAIALMVGGALVDKILDNVVSTDNYVIFSLTKITIQGKTKTIGIGAFGNVFLTKRMERIFDEGLMEN